MKKSAIPVYMKKIRGGILVYLILGADFGAPVCNS
jgi:hypothetical protein